MKILLDECVTKKLKPHLSDYEVSTVTELNLSGIKNGKLMQFCMDQKFDILLTIDKNLMFQQNMDKYAVIIIVFDSASSKIDELISFVPVFKSEIQNFKKHQAYLIQK